MRQVSPGWISHRSVRTNRFHLTRANYGFGRGNRVIGKEQEVLAHPASDIGVAVFGTRFVFPFIVSKTYANPNIFLTNVKINDTIIKHESHRNEKFDKILW
jgi:hypothetical protein